MITLAGLLWIMFGIGIVMGVAGIIVGLVHESQRVNDLLSDIDPDAPNDVAL